jgi:hypothetical protein
MNFRLVALVISSITLLVIPAPKPQKPIGGIIVTTPVKLASSLQTVALAQQSKLGLLAVPVVKSTISTPVAPTSYSEPDDTAKAYIYDHESGNNPRAINSSSGACGLGQALPCSKMPCSLSDYECQDNYFTSYMLSRYGTWQAAMAYWEGHQNW